MARERRFRLLKEPLQGISHSGTWQPNIYPDEPTVVCPLIFVPRQAEWQGLGVKAPHFQFEVNGLKPGGVEQLY